MQLIDTHVHINFDLFEGELDALQQRWQEAGVVKLIHSCVEPGEFSRTQALADRFLELVFSVGLHPLDVNLWTAEMPGKIRTLAQSDRRVVAIGEMGLDFYKSEDHTLQKQVFWEQLAIAQSLNLPVIIHCRDAAQTMKDILEKFFQEVGPVRGVMHCWSGTPIETQWFLDLGFYISFSGVVTFKNATVIQESAQMVPSDRILVETDCPFLAPVPKRGKRNEPAYVRYVAEFVAQLRGVEAETLAKTTTENACRLFGLCLSPQDAQSLAGVR